MSRHEMRWMDMKLMILEKQESYKLKQARHAGILLLALKSK